MNNSQISFDREEPKDELLPRLTEQEAKTLKIIEAVQELSKSAAWSTLKLEVFDRLASSLEKDLQLEAKKEDPDPKRLNRLAGELKWAARFADLSKFEDSFKLELQRIRTHKNATD